MTDKEYSFTTRTVNLGRTGFAHNSLRVPIYQSSTFVFDDVDQGAALFSGEKEGFIYSRLSNPTRQTLEHKMAELEQGGAAIALSSGMSAISGLIMGLLESGDHLIAPRDIYGGTYGFLANRLNKWDIGVSFVDMTIPEQVEGEINGDTRLIFIETPANPGMTVIDLKAMVEIARDHGLTTVVDNTFMSPYLQQPLTLGVDFVVHSATKYIGGHGDTVGGIIVGPEAEVSDLREGLIKDFGGLLAPFDAFLLLRGLKTLALRMDRVSENASQVARFLEEHRAVKQVNYPGLPAHPQYELASRQMRQPGGMLSFEVRGGLKAGKRLLNSVELCTLAVSLGDVDTLIQHPASMTHSGLNREQRQAAGIKDGLIRLSVGIEGVEDIIADLKQALDKIKKLP